MHEGFVDLSSLFSTRRTQTNARYISERPLITPKVISEQQQALYQSSSLKISKKIVLFLYVCVSYCAGVDAVNFYVCHLLLLLIYLPYVSGCDETPSSSESHFCYCLFCFNIANLIIFQHLSKYLSHSVWFTDIPSPLSSPPGSAGRKRSAVRTRQSSKHTMVTPER